MATSTNCKFCEHNSPIINCKTCEIWCCYKCFDNHKSSCKRLTEFQYHICKRHTRPVEGFCYKCYEIICKECAIQNHKGHNICSIPTGLRNITSKYTAAVSEDLLTKEIRLKSFFQICQANFPGEIQCLATCIKEEEEKWKNSIAGVKDELILQLGNMQMFYHSKEKIEELLKKAKVNFDSLRNENFSLTTLWRWSCIIRLLQNCNNMFIIGKTSIVGNLTNVSDIRQLFRSRVINSNRIPIDTVTDVEELSVFFEKNLNIKDQSRVASLRPMVNNEDVLEEGFVNVIYPNEDEERNKKALEEECMSLKHQIKELTEIIADKDISLSLYKDEKEYIMSTSKRLNEVVMATMKNTSSIDLIKEISFPQTGNEFKDSCAKVFDAVIKSVQQLKHDLTESKNVIDAKCKSIAIWTDQQNADANSMQKTFEKELYEKKSKLALYNDEARRNEIKIKELQSSNDDLRNQCGKLQQQAFDLQKSLERERQQSYLVKENAELKTRLKQIDKWIKQQNYNTENYTSTIEQLHLQLSKIGKDLQSVKSEKDDLQTRLSSMAGEKLTKGNPSITDLGDPNRPMKIGEKYGELYDNEWTDAMESVESIQNCFPGLKNAEQEEIVIHHMYRLLMCCFRECRNISMKQIQNIGQKVAEAMCLNIKSEDELFTLPGCKEVQIYRRQNSEGFANYLVKSQIICKDVLENWDYGHKSEIVLQELITTPFFHKCVHICWCMAIQDPLMYLAEHLPPDTKFDKNEYKEFVKSGDKVKFMVWPALYLHKDGPLLHKGVVQAYW